MSNDHNPKARRTALLKQLDELERRRFFGDLVLKFKDGQLTSDVDVREVIKLDRPGGNAPSNG